MTNTLGYKTTNNNPVGFYFCIFILFVTSMGCWIGWAGRSKYIYAVFILFMFLTIYNYYYIKFDLCKKNIILSLILCISNVVFDEFKIEKIGIFIVYFVICCLNREHQNQCLKYIYKWFAWLMIPSIFIYFLVQMGLISSLGNLYLYDDESHGYFQQSYLIRSNYIFYCFSNFYDFRFNGPFIEPGHLGIMTAFLLFADGYDFKKYTTYILIFTLLLTMSLAGYVLCFAGYLFYKYDTNKIQFSFIVFFLASIIIVYFFGKIYNGGDNLLNNYILSRLEYDEEKGFSGNNRVFGQIDIYYAAMFNDTQTLLFGYNKDIIDYLAWNHSRGSGFIMCMVSHGLIGTIAGLLFYIFYYLIADNRKTALLFLVFVLMLYWQRTYPFWFSWLICYVFGITSRSKYLYENRNINVSPQP